MSLETLLEAVEATPLAVAVAESGWLFPAAESAHVVALALVVGTIMMVDLRLLGLSRRGVPVTQATGEVLPFTWAAFAVAVATGLLMFVSRASDYWENPFFRIKLVLLALAGVNMVVFHFVTWRSVRSWETGTPAPGARLAGLLSLLLWIGVVVCGRWIGFA